MTLPRHSAGAVSPLRVHRGWRQRLRGFAIRGYPLEVCGLLVGRVTRRGAHVLRITRSRNLARDRAQDRYVLDPQHFFTVDDAARAAGHEIVGIWHTHPDHPALPSSTDHGAAWEGYSYLIVSVNSRGVEDARAWRLVDGAFVEQPIEEAEP